MDEHDVTLFSVPAYSQEGLKHGHPIRPPVQKSGPIYSGWAVSKIPRQVKRLQIDALGLLAGCPREKATRGG